jgi:hypothetical protein
MTIKILTAATMLAALVWMPPAPGTTVQTQYVAFNGESAADRWPVVVSKKLVGSNGSQQFYQWYLSIYQLRRGAYRLRYESPGNGGPLSRVAQANGARMWFPVQQLKIVGRAPLMGGSAQQLVVASHEMAADCGGATITVFGGKPGSTAGPVATVTNPCDLSAKLGADGTSVELAGPYYAANAPLCCPTKPQVTANLRYRDGKWVESPHYFKLE